MKFCQKCGRQIIDEAVICPYCGCMVNGGVYTNGSGNTPYQKSQASLVLGIIGIIFAWLFALVGHITSIIGIVLGTKEYRETGRTTGLVLSIIGEICSIISSVIGVVLATNMYY